MSNRMVEHAGSIDATHVTRGRWIRHDRPIWPFVWRGLLPVAGLIVLGVYAAWPFARHQVEATVSREMRAQLDANGYPWVNVAVSGQHVVLSGVRPLDASADGALAVARSAACPTWAGRLTCAVAVSAEFTAAPPAAAASPVAVAPAVAKAEVEACEKSLADLLVTSKIQFAAGSATIDSRSSTLLDSLAGAARACPGVIRVEGHTDALGLAAGNRRLSEARAQAVRAALIARGLSSSRLQAEGFGAERPIADNDSPAGRMQNRRIEFRVVAATAN